MAGSIKVQVDFRKDEAVRQLRSLSDRETKRILARALNRAGTTVVAEGARAIAQELGGKINIGQIKKTIRLTRATTRALTAVVKATGKSRIPLPVYGARETRSGVRVTIGGRSINIPHAFIAQRGQRKAVFIRASSGDGRLFTQGGLFNPATKRLPIAEIFAPGVPQAFVNDKVINLMKKRGAERFIEVVNQEFRYSIGKLRGNP